MSDKIEQDLKLLQVKPPAVNQQFLQFKNLNATRAIPVTLEEHKELFFLCFKSLGPFTQAIFAAI